MRPPAAILIALLIALPAAILPLKPAQAEVSVTFVNSFYYSDLAEKTPEKRESTLKDIRNAFVDLGARYLKPGQLLKIEVLDIEKIAMPTRAGAPAGRVAERSGPQPLRMEIQYALQQNGRIISHSRESLSDINYSANQSAAASKDSLLDVKDMLRDWFAQTFGGSIFGPN